MLEKTRRRIERLEAQYAANRPVATCPPETAKDSVPDMVSAAARVLRARRGQLAADNRPRFSESGQPVDNGQKERG